ncbi:MAG: hypothetical protein K2I69_04305 [Muribaculaceae bacterium]|nr:hypothetical protein [Muribaculaceae bacterium]
MNIRSILTLSLIGLGASGALAQSAVDAYNITPTQLRGTARFVAMGGAFTSLGSDISCMTQNPAGLGLYRKSDLGLTFDISMRNYGSETSSGKYSDNETRAKFDNIGYVGVINLNGALSAIQWGVGYNRLAVTDRLVNGYNYPTSGSLTNYIAGYTNGTNAADILDEQGYDPFFSSNNDWLSILAYNSYMINTNGDEQTYSGLYGNGTVGDALYNIRERGYTDEYDINIAGNVKDIVYWGFGIGIMDVNYTREAYYSESMEKALVYDTRYDMLTSGNAGFDLNNVSTINGTGANLKFGLIIRPVDDFRVGFAIHTPTWLHLSHSGAATVDYNYTPDGVSGSRPLNSGSFSSPVYDYTSRLNTPWRFMVGASYTIGGRAIISADYERVAYADMKMKKENDSWGRGYVENTYANEDIKNYYKAANIFRIGAEVRLSNNFSARAGYNRQGSNVTSQAYNNKTEIFTSGMDPSYSFDNTTQNICLGLGFHVSGWYLDLTYQHTRRTGTFSAYTPSAANSYAPTASLTDKYNNIVVTTGFRF